MPLVALMIFLPKAIIIKLRKILFANGISFLRSKTYQELLDYRQEAKKFKSFRRFAKFLRPQSQALALELFEKSSADNFQDIFVMLLVGEIEKGFFVEFGATDGVMGSNALLMEKYYDWPGILAEPARCWQYLLAMNRKSHISNDCVWVKSGSTLNFREIRNSGYSSLESNFKNSLTPQRRDSNTAYEVTTITLLDLLESFNAPHGFTFLSIDTEGSEFDILNTFDFKKYRPKVVVVEHNYREDRNLILQIMLTNEYVRAPIEVSLYDDWYVCSSLEQKMNSLFIL